MNVNVLIKEKICSIAKKVYVAPNIPEKKLNAATEAFHCESDRKSVLALFDSTVFGMADEGLLFTGTKFVQKVMLTSPLQINYDDIDSVEYKNYELVNEKGKREQKEYAQITLKDGSVHKFKSGMGFFPKPFVELISEIIELEEYADENQLKSISEMSEEFKIAYLQIIVNMTFSDDGLIDERELSEIFQLMTRLTLSAKSRSTVLNYIQNVNSMTIIPTETLYKKMLSMVIPPKRAASKSRINTSPAFSAGRVSLLKPSYAFALE